MATMHWGRKETIIFPPHSAIYTYGAVFFAVILTGLFVYLRFTFGNTPLVSTRRSTSGRALRAASPPAAKTSTAW